MAKRRSRGDGGLRWSEARQRWIAEVTIGYTPAGKRIVRSASGRTKTEAKEALKDLLHEVEDDLSADAAETTVAETVTDWLTYGLPKCGKKTRDKWTGLANTHVIPALGARKLRGKPGGDKRRVLSADDIDKWLAEKATAVSTRTLRDLLSILRRSIARAQKRDKVGRNVALLCEVPEGRPGRPSKALTFDQAVAVLGAAEADKSTIGAYVVVSLLAGVRTEEARPLDWPHVDLVGKPDAEPPVPPHVMVWRSVRVGGDTKTPKSRRSVGLPARAVAELKAHQARQRRQRERAGARWKEHGLVFASRVGTEMSAGNVRRGFRRILTAAGVHADDWTPRELRHSFVSLLSDGGLPVEKISLLVGHRGTAVTELVYRHQLRPVVRGGAELMDRLLPGSAA